MQWPFNHCLHARVMLRASSALLCSRASGPSSKRALRTCRSQSGHRIWYGHINTRYAIRHLTSSSKIFRRDNDWGMWRRGERDETNLNGHLDSTVLYCTVPKYLSSTSSATVCKVADIMLVYLARQVVMISTSESYLVWGWRKRVIGESIALSIYAFLF